MLTIANTPCRSRLLLGTAQYPSLSILQEAVLASETDVITVSVRRQGESSKAFWQAIKAMSCHILPNTAGCLSAHQAVQTAQMAREIFETNWIKLEVIGDDYSLHPHCLELITAAEQLVKLGFEVLPYCTDDLVVCQKLVDVGCNILMPLAAPIGSGLGINNPYALSALRARFPQQTLIVDAGIGKPSDACIAMELGFDAVLLNTAVAQSPDPVRMARAFAQAIDAGAGAYQAGMIRPSSTAKASTPLIDRPFWISESDYER